MDTVGSRELEEECVVIIVTNSATPKTSAGFCTENLPIGGLDRVMEGAFKLQQMQEQPLKGKNPQPLKYHLAKEQMDMSYKLLNQSQQPNTNVRSCNLAQTKLHSRKAIDNAKVHEGLYFFGDEDSRTRQPLAFGFKSISVSDDEIML
ncbi:hypothetical protein CK203_116526 [Vitis vinifera]|uniref:Uncharacterized protein n=1 Tax=Vitis vinifera TaxID=29760 RepID=A0A438EPA2_VITVI|nr:hypothetical protein CK203_116526 [Vitis vinifera]